MSLILIVVNDDLLQSRVIVAVFDAGFGARVMLLFILACSMVPVVISNFRIMLSSPTIQPISGLIKCTERRLWSVPDGIIDQVKAPSVVFIIFPESPTTYPFNESRKKTPFRKVAVFKFIAFHVTPASVDLD